MPSPASSCRAKLRRTPNRKADRTAAPEPPLIPPRRPSRLAPLIPPGGFVPPGGPPCPRARTSVPFGPPRISISKSYLHCYAGPRTRGIDGKEKTAHGTTTADHRSPPPHRRDRGPGRRRLRLRAGAGGTGGPAGLQHAQDVALSYNDDGQLVDRGSTEGAAAILALLSDDWKWPVVSEDLNPDDPVTNTGDRVHVPDGHHRPPHAHRHADGRADGARVLGRRRRRRAARSVRTTYTGGEWDPSTAGEAAIFQPGVYQVPVANRYYTQFNRPPPARRPCPRAGLGRPRARPLRRARRGCHHGLEPGAGPGRRRRDGPHGRGLPHPGRWPPLGGMASSSARKPPAAA